MAPSSTPDANPDYDAIEAAIAETNRGRWFLAEFRRRVKIKDTERLLAVVARLEAVLQACGTPVTPALDDDIFLPPVEMPPARRTGSEASLLLKRRAADPPPSPRGPDRSGERSGVSADTNPGGQDRAAVLLFRPSGPAQD